MPRLRRLSGADIVRIFETFGFRVESQRGSHIKVRRNLPSGEIQTLVVPSHRSVKLGMARALYKEAVVYIAEGELRPHFYTD